MNYERIYRELIEMARARETVEGENHHILPHSMGGANDPSNIVRLLTREHFVAHALLVRFTTGMDKVRMLFAFGFMSTFSKTNNMRARVTGRLFASSKKAAKKARLLLKEQGDWISPVKGTKWFTDGERRYRLRADAPEILLLRLTLCHGASKGLKWFTDGNGHWMLPPEEGLRRGLDSGAPAAGKPKRFSNIVKRQRAEMVWFNDGMKSTKLKPTDPRTAGLARGRLLTATAIDNIRLGASWTRTPEHNCANSNRQVGSRFFNDGSRNFVIRQGEQVPVHLQKGRLPHRPRQKQNEPT